MKNLSLAPSAFGLLRLGKKDFIYVIISVASLAVSCLFDVLGSQYFGLLFASVAIGIALWRCDQNNLFQLMWVIALVLFGFLPALILAIERQDAELWLLQILIISTLPILLMTKDCVYKGSVACGRQISVRHAFIFSLFSLFTLFVSEGSSFLYVTPALMVAIAMCIKSATSRQVIIVLVAYASYFSIYMIVFWQGFGRLIIGGLLIPLYFIVAYERGWWFNKYIVILASLIGGVLASVGRIQSDTVAESLKSDSIFSPYVLAAEIAAEHKNWDLSAWAGQFFAFLYGGFPRDIWPTKPIGYGRQYVVESMDTRAFSEGHSIAALFLGENFDYLGYLWWAGALLTLYVLIMIFRFFHSLDRGSGVLGALVCLWIPTFMWGGVAAFSQRFQIGVAAALLIYILSFLRWKTLPGKM